MPRNTIRVAAAALVLAAGGAFAQTQQPPATPPGPMMGAGPGPGTPMMGRGPWHDRTGGPGMMGDGPGRGWMHPHMMLMMMALVDTDGSETLSLEEVQAVHARMFKYADADDNGELTLEELRAFMQGGATPGGQ
jgi:hypothetical protein